MLFSTLLYRLAGKLYGQSEWAVFCWLVDFQGKRVGIEIAYLITVRAGTPLCPFSALK